MAWFDFSAGKNGNIFDFLMETDGLSFPEAVERLARDAGLALPLASPEAEAEEKARASLHEVLARAASYFSARLAGDKEARPARTSPAGGLTRSCKAGFAWATPCPKNMPCGIISPARASQRKR